jgi:hypothetical protein
MKRNKFLSTAIALCMIAFFTVNWKQSPSAEPTSVTIRLSRGFFTAQGGIEASGTYTMSPVVVRGSTFHCTNTFVTADGTITALSVCHEVTGIWHIVDATGIYEGLHGTGSLIMDASGETWEGKVH